MYKLLLITGHEIFFTEKIYSDYLSEYAKNEDRFILRGGDGNVIIFTLHMDKVVYTSKIKNKFSLDEISNMKENGKLFDKGNVNI